MSTTGLPVFDETIHLTNSWLKELMDELDSEDRHRAYLTLRVVLHALRDSLSVDEAAQLAAQLPMLVRGFFFEGWHPAGKPVADRSRSGFLQRVEAGFPRTPEEPPVDAEAAARAVLGLLARRLSDGGKGTRHGLPKDMRALWPESAEASA